MANLNNLSVSQITELRGEATGFDSSAKDLRNITNDILAVVDNAAPVWQGKAYNAYQQKFHGLQDEMDILFDQVMEYCEDLLAIADEYEAAENDNESTAQALNDAIGLIH